MVHLPRTNYECINVNTISRYWFYNETFTKPFIKLAPREVQSQSLKNKKQTKPHKARQTQAQLGKRYMYIYICSNSRKLRMFVKTHFNYLRCMCKFKFSHCSISASWHILLIMISNARMVVVQFWVCLTLKDSSIVSQSVWGSSELAKQIIPLNYHATLVVSWILNTDLKS